MTTKNEEKKAEPTKAELEAEAVTLAEQDNTLTTQIDAATKARNLVRKQRRSVEGRLTTININSKAK